MRTVDTFPRSLETLKHIPKVRHLRTLLRQFILIAHPSNGGIEQLRIAERHFDNRFQRAECGQRNHPVAKDAIVNGVILQFGCQFTLRDRIDFREILLKQFTMAKQLNGQMGQSHVADRYQIFIMPLFQLVE